MNFLFNAANLSFRGNYLPSLCYITRNTISKEREHVNRTMFLDHDKRKNNRGAWKAV